jgi:flagellar hook-associated protein 1 FlgK
MGLLTALNAATSGLRTTQAGIDVVAQNIANADTVGYSRRRMEPLQTVSGDRTSGVRGGEIQRILDLAAQKQLRLETSGAAYTSLASRFATELDRLFGPPGGVGSLDGAVNGFTQSLQALLSNPASYSARAAVLDAGTALAGRIASIAGGVQLLRGEAENRISAAVTRANELLTGIAEINGKVVGQSAIGSSPALLDERDRLITELSQIVDVHVRQDQNGSVTLTTTAGLMLFDGSSAVRLSFDGRGTVGAHSAYSTVDAERGVGTITATTGQGTTVDIVAGKLIRSGEIAAALELRDETLVQAQRQLDELAAGLSRALSDRAAPVTDLAVPGTGGFDVDLTGLQAGNAVTLQFNDLAAGGVAKRIVIVPTNGAAPNAVPAADTADPAARIIRVDISGGLAAAIGAIETALEPQFDVTNPSPLGANNLRVLGVAGLSGITGLSAGITVTGLTDGHPQLPFFVDAGYGNTPFTGSFEGRSHLTGLAQRLALNPALRNDPSRLVVHSLSPMTPQGDTARPQHLLDSLTRATRTFSAASGIGGVNAPYASTVLEFAQRVVETQGANAESMGRLNEGQQVAYAAIQSRFAELAGVNVDQEMALLVQLQTAYGANARVMTAVRDMLDMLLRI